jgi:sialidase-1
MKHFISGPSAVKLILSLVLVYFAAHAPTACSALETEEPFFEMQEIFQGQRFPNIVVGMDGTVLAFRGENNPLEVRRSEDGGKSWGPVIQVGTGQGTMGAAVVDEGSGDIMVFEHYMKPSFTMYRSRDQGNSWIKEQVLIKPDGFGGIGSTHGADSGITLQHGPHKGRLLVPARVFGPVDDNSRRWWPYHYNSAIYSDNGGVTWHTSAPFPVLGTGEAALAELSSGRIYYNSRMHLAEDGKRRIAWSDDGGETWRHPEVSPELPDGPRGTSYGCMGGVTRLPSADEDILIYSNLDEDTATRRRITVWASFDGGKSWPVKRLVYEGPSAYSSLAAGREGTPSEGLIYLMFEGGPGGMYSALQVARFNLGWITGGKSRRQ